MRKTTRGRKGLARLNLYANLSARRKSKAEGFAKRHAEYLASLPKQPLKRFFYRLQPKQIFQYLFSHEGRMLLLKIVGASLVVLIIFVAAMFAYFRNQLYLISPGELSKRVQTTVTRYYDRNGVLLWEDKGNGDYKLVVDSKDISNYMKQATVAIEDKDFYRHPGISINGIGRAILGGGTQGGGSTLTQQLVKNVFFSSSNKDRTVSRKIKEIILAIEVERMYNKDQILTMYLNEVPYGGRRNGVESASQTYFGKPAKDLNLAESALLASIPQQPGTYNPYNLEGNRALIERQHVVLDDMANQGYITKQQADDAKKVAVLDSIKPEIADNEDIKAPHFIAELRKQLENEFGEKTIREGGLTIKTTLDYRLQQIAEKAVNDAYKSYIAHSYDKSDNIGFTAIDVPTGQILSMVGSYNYNDKNYGQTNVATSPLEPGSSIKPFDYSQLFKQRTGQNYGAGSNIDDKNIDNIYCVGTPSPCSLNNFDNKFYGPMSIREALSQSRNSPAVQAAYIAGMSNVVKLAQDMGDRTFCAGKDYGLSAAIGGTCQVKQVEHVNAYASLARGGVYQPESYVLEVKNSQGQFLKQWKDQSKRVLDPQIPYLISDILSDANARSRVFGPPSHQMGMYIPSVKTAVKTGTNDDGHGNSRSHWMMSYSPRVAAGVWVGRHDGSALRGLVPFTPATGAVMNDFMVHAHKEVFQPDGTWKPGDWFTRPSGIQNIDVNGRNDIYPSWYIKPKNAEGIKMQFDKVSKKKATSCTPDRAKQDVVVQSIQDPITNKTTLTAPDGFDPNSEDDAHKCSDTKPFVSLTVQQSADDPNKYNITANVNQGTFGLQHLDILVNNQSVKSQDITAPGTVSVDYTFTNSGDQTISATVIDQGFYDATDTKTVTVTPKTTTPTTPTSPTTTTPPNGGTSGAVPTPNPNPDNPTDHTHTLPWQDQH